MPVGAGCGAGAVETVRVATPDVVTAPPIVFVTFTLTFKPESASETAGKTNVAVCAEGLSVMSLHESPSHAQPPALVPSARSRYPLGAVLVVKMRMSST